MKRKRAKPSVRPLPADYLEQMRKLPPESWCRLSSGNEVVVFICLALLRDPDGNTRISDRELVSFVNQHGNMIAAALNQITGGLSGVTFSGPIH
jgi:hypothetical protein